jgi:hypothetical protein
MATRKRKGAPRDVALLYAPTDDGEGARILRSRDGSIETGEVRPMKEGQPIHRGELVRLVPRTETPCVCDVEVLYTKAADESAASAAKDGPASEGLGRPAQVATDDYRLNWDRIFGRGSSGRPKRDSSLN